jgi:excisionase family DNA binding protein
MERVDQSDKLTLASAASFLGISPHTLRSWTRERRIPFYRCGRRLVFVRKDLDVFLADCRVTPFERPERA